ncbi:hypothetical protein SAMN05428975_3449 [Mucilaginibacter sp. OK268]|uniref:hypothetical protein n=1 Tax=Mucilaginibacter sp. OK268 TaxID=1881048 RepID=UPI00088D6290|nr:hypothetical protein [Mucilaginibacter sp. OK268]SDP90542.1 hypothetical protein SAMN05428975_3449 [Mucilaginibacter sp. OK268]
MKKLLIITVFFATSCSHSKQYSSCESIAPALKDEHYKDLVKDWGESYQKEYYGPNNEWLCKWHGVGINGTDATIHFEDITYSWGEHGPFTVRGTECESNLKPTSNVNSESSATDNSVDKSKSDATSKSEQQDNIVVNSLNELPNPSDAVKTEKTYKVLNSTEKQIYEWYALHYKAKYQKLTFYTYLDESDMAAVSHMTTEGNNVLLYFNKVDISAQ